ncbi:riboflavin biosynthesis protein RibF [Lactobacillus sp. YT155]|uniref:riboflavin biosynthesis protein RibF n=1 Tax=Lactobacillus sp. YT155 TaxID=3060955 RepID=UPI0026600C6A|nr:riboflavin biosynthesis protein RibF [Lactobacillus sp. YT155]MDO1605501.1 riboflavin biosynthesis protein RibF [Lactobacillus sp. YT155]
MKTINLEYPFDKNKIPNEPIALALGFFDGVHLGHQAVVKTAKQVADKDNLKLAVMTFNQSPSTVFGSESEDSFRYLSTLTRKEELFSDLGVDYLYVVKFTDSLIKLNGQEFVDNCIISLHAQAVIAGFDYTYGPKETANMTTLVDYAKGRFSITSVDEIFYNQGKLGTTSIKAALSNGEITNANEQLGYNYQNTGTVIHGLKRGRELGFPTANLDVDKKEYLPADGVYITEILIDDIWYPSMTSVGFNITFDDVMELSIETYILNFNQDIYGKEVKLKWDKFLRPEIKFAGIDALIEQLKQDEKDTENYFEKTV